MGWGLKDGWEELLSLDSVAAVNDVSGECIEEKGVDPVIVVPTSSFLLTSWLLLPFELEDEDVDGRKSLVVGGSEIIRKVKIYERQELARLFACYNITLFVRHGK